MTPPTLEHDGSPERKARRHAARHRYPPAGTAGQVNPVRSARYGPPSMISQPDLHRRRCSAVAREPLDPIRQTDRPRLAATARRSPRVPKMRSRPPGTPRPSWEIIEKHALPMRPAHDLARRRARVAALGKDTSAAESIRPHLVGLCGSRPPISANSAAVLVGTKGAYLWEDGCQGRSRAADHAPALRRLRGPA